MNNFAPIILFTYVRLDALKKTIYFLKKNKLSKFTEIFIYSDGYKSQIDKIYVLKVREYLKKISGFKKIKIIFRGKNYGLAKNITSGVSEIINKFGKAIILEDDIVVASNFLSYMNQALIHYEKNKKIWHINSWNYELDIKDNYYSKTFLTRLMNCWGWATWKDRWKVFVKDPEGFAKNFDQQDIKKFNLDNNYNYWSQVKRNFDNKIKTWAVFWYACIYKNKGLCVSPILSLSRNIGSDNFSEHSPSNENSFDNIPKYFFKISNKNFKFDSNLVENEFFLKKIISKIKNNKLKNPFFLKFLLKFIKITKFKSFTIANFFSKYFFFHNYHSDKINFFKVHSFRNQKNLNLLNSPTFKLIYDSILTYKKNYNKYPKTILDVGGGIGESILELRRNYNINIDCTVLENKNLVTLIKKNRIRHCNFISDLNTVLAMRSFDIIIFSAVLEYLEKPYELLQKLKTISAKLIIIGRIDTNSQGCLIQASKLYQNVPYSSNLPKNKNELVFYPFQKVSVKRISSVLTEFKVLSKNIDQNKNLNIIYQKLL